jgi:hypothetical protein
MMGSCLVTQLIVLSLPPHRRYYNSDDDSDLAHSSDEEPEVEHTYLDLATADPSALPPPAYRTRKPPKTPSEYSFPETLGTDRETEMSEADETASTYSDLSLQSRGSFQRRLDRATNAFVALKNASILAEQLQQPGTHSVGRGKLTAHELQNISHVNPDQEALRQTVLTAKKTYVAAAQTPKEYVPLEMATLLPAQTHRGYRRTAAYYDFSESESEASSDTTEGPPEIPEFKEGQGSDISDRDAQEPAAYGGYGYAAYGGYGYEYKADGYDPYALAQTPGKDAEGYPSTAEGQQGEQGLPLTQQRLTAQQFFYFNSDQGGPRPNFNHYKKSFSGYSSSEDSEILSEPEAPVPPATTVQPAEITGTSRVVLETTVSKPTAVNGTAPIVPAATVGGAVASAAKATVPAGSAVANTPTASTAAGTPAATAPPAASAAPVSAVASTAAPGTATEVVGLTTNVETASEWSATEDSLFLSITTADGAQKRHSAAVSAPTTVTGADGALTGDHLRVSLTQSEVSSLAMTSQRSAGTPNAGPAQPQEQAVPEQAPHETESVTTDWTSPSMHESLVRSWEQLQARNDPDGAGASYLPAHKHEAYRSQPATNHADMALMLGRGAERRDSLSDTSSVQADRAAALTAERARETARLEAQKRLEALRAQLTRSVEASLEVLGPDTAALARQHAAEEVRNCLVTYSVLQQLLAHWSRHTIRRKSLAASTINFMHLTTIGYQSADRGGGGHRAELPGRRRDGDGQRDQRVRGGTGEWW